MKHVASMVVGEDRIVGKGYTQEEAVEACLAQVRQHLFLGVELALGVVLPQAVVSKMPRNLPKGMRRLLILERCNHSSGDAYDWRFFAVRCARPFTLLKRFGQGEAEPQRTYGGPLEPGPLKYSFLDCNADYEFLLPYGSWEFVDGAWVACQVAKYSY